MSNRIPHRADARGSDPARFTGYFTLAAVIHLAAVASRFDLVARQIPEPAALAIMVAQFPLLLLSGYFEGGLDHGRAGRMPRWMQIQSRPVKLAFTFAMVYLTCVALQTWDVKIGPLDPTPPLSFPPAHRALWFAMFTVGMTFPFYLAASGVLIPILRVITAPLRALPRVLGAPLALVVGGAIGAGVLSAVTSVRIGRFAERVHAAIDDDPRLAISVALVTVLVPLLVGLVTARRD